MLGLRRIIVTSTSTSTSRLIVPCRSSTILSTKYSSIMMKRYYSSTNNNVSSPVSSSSPIIENSKSDELREFVEDEMKDYQTDQDTDFLEIFLQKHSFEMTKDKNSYTLQKKYKDEQITININPDNIQEPLCLAELPDYTPFLVHVTKPNTELQLRCEYTKDSDEYKIKRIDVKSGNDRSAVHGSLLDERAEDAFINFLRDRGVSSDIPKVIDILLNMRDDREWKKFISVLSTFWK
eukprot:TRINITY_DN845_c0_g1_i2.p1 TRINITY_DN845_c0_g1~~TRINITY_DN845_c0_g1_i2.p1  ORF type:complete len:236 (-),score=54.35 TRINITY_DN845_c0_g1_i2:24-731(-)